MSIELITGASPIPHITANDYRAINRSIFGQGRYILKDTEQLETFVAASAGQIIINSGICLWSGMHIRCESDTTIAYTPPTTTSEVYIYLHYVKDTDNYETVDFVVSVGEQKSPVLNELDDSTREAYTLFASFTHNPATGVAENVVHHFEVLESMDDFNMRNIVSKISGAKNEAIAYTDTKVAGLRTSLEATIAITNGNVTTAQNTANEAKALAKSEVVFWSGKSALSGGLEISYDESKFNSCRFLSFCFCKTTKGEELGVATVARSVTNGGTGYRNGLSICVDGSKYEIYFTYIKGKFMFDNVTGLSITKIMGHT